MKNIKYIIVGRQASGKTTLAKKLEEKGLHLLKTHTTRTKRFPEENQYHFVDKDHEETIKDQTLAKDTIGDVDYYTTKQDVLTADIMVLTPSGIIEVAKTFPDVNFRIIYIVAKEDDNIEKIQERIDQKSETKESTNSRSDWELWEFSWLDNILISETIEGQDLPQNISNVQVFYNEYKPEQINERAEIYYNDMKLLKNLAILVEKSAKYDIVDCNDEGKYLLVTDRGKRYVSSALFAANLMSSEEGRDRFFITCLYHGVFEDQPPVKNHPGQLSLFD